MRMETTWKESAVEQLQNEEVKKNDDERERKVYDHFIITFFIHARFFTIFASIKYLREASSSAFLCMFFVSVSSPRDTLSARKMREREKQ